jgi:hypothetical protein
MSANEVQAIQKSIQEELRDLWFINATSMGAKIDKPSDLIKFSWETPEETPEQTEEQIRIAQENLINAFNSINKKEFNPIH